MFLFFKLKVFVMDIDEGCMLVILEMGVMDVIGIMLVIVVVVMVMGGGVVRGEMKMVRERMRKSEW